MPEVSVIVSLYNHGHYLEQCVRSALDQTFADLEVVIVDDASTDGSLEVAHALQRLDPARVRVFANPENLGVSRTRNLGVHKSGGSLLAFLDADDFWRADKIANQVQAFREDPALGVCHCGVRIECDEHCARWVADNQGMAPEFFARWKDSFDMFSREAVRFNQLDYFRHLLMANNICLSSVAVRRPVFKQARGFLDLAGCQAEDWLLWLKCSMLTTFRSLPEPLAAYRFHHESHTARVFMDTAFDFQGLCTRLRQAARNFNPPRFDALLNDLRIRDEQPSGAQQS